MSDALLDVRDLVTRFRTKRGTLVAVDGVSFNIGRGETLGLVGESGCGKSATGQSIMRLIEPPGEIAGGSMVFEGEDLRAKSREEMRQVRGARIAMIFQDPTTTLNPVFPVGGQIAELFRYHTSAGPKEAKARVIDMLAEVGIPRPHERYDAYPHEFSGGMQQRVIIACALVLRPALVIADEPTTALDVTVQAQILALLQRLQRSETNTAVILISHDLGVVAQMCERVCVMYAGNIVEVATTADILDAPKHPYTVGLMQSIPRLDLDEDAAVRPIPGVVADPIRPPSGCKFHPRCAHAFARCYSERPTLKATGNGHMAACHLYDQT
ncbi:MAG: ABC transporter ATP-binding protein [Alphaproteobacteria bacterium]|nr:ABC transporter ATP-binding protein [Alphaproteobacteria bacterium]